MCFVGSEFSIIGLLNRDYDLIREQVRNQERDKSKLKGTSDFVCLSCQETSLWKSPGLFLIHYFMSIRSCFCPLQTLIVSHNFLCFVLKELLPTKFLQREFMSSLLHMILHSSIISLMK